jgi:hypothetical protein
MSAPIVASAILLSLGALSFCVVDLASFDNELRQLKRIGRIHW